MGKELPEVRPHRQHKGALFCQLRLHAVHRLIPRQEDEVRPATAPANDLGIFRGTEIPYRVGICLRFQLQHGEVQRQAEKRLDVLSS